jgi:beta-galactosidase GanA
MEKTMKTLHENNLNSVLVSVSWEIIEPEEGVFDFTSVDELIRIARENNMKLGILWFGSWKNGLSPYAPDWVISDTKRFARVKNEKGENTRTLTPLCTATRDADAKAYNELMKHIAATDSKENTVIVMQVENEVGTLGQTRDFSKEAGNAFKSRVPEQLIQYLLKNRNTLEIELKTAWESNGSKSQGTWTEVFGKSDETDLFFMAWYYSIYINAIAESGKKTYNIPMYVNAWMPGPRPNPGKPGNYPSGGPILTVLDIWKAGAPSIDFLAPDLYGGDFKDEANFFHRFDNPLFIPETRTTEGPGTYVFAREDAICFSPFGIDSRGEEMAKEYGLLGQLVPVIAQFQGSGKMSGLYKSQGDTLGRDFKLNNDITVSVKYQKPWRFGPATEMKDPSGRPIIPASYGLFIQTGENEFIVAGINLAVSAFSANPEKEVWLKDAWEGNYENGEWKPKALHNGDEAGFLRSGDPVYRIGAYRTFPSEPAIFHFKAVPYDR